MDLPTQASAGNDFEHILLKTTQERLHQKKSDGLSFADAILPVFQEVLEFSDRIIQGLEESGQTPKVACKTGCSYCCHSQVNIIPIEALLISSFIHTDFTGPQICTLRAGISRTRSLTAGKSIEQVYAMKSELPCLFLSNKRCSIYKMRPSICRSWNSLDSYSCRTAYDSVDPKSSVSASPARNLVFGTTRALFAQISDACTLQSDTLLLHNAMSDCFDSTDPLDRWAGGHDVFRYESQGTE